MILCVIFFSTNLLADNSEIDWDILKADSIEEIMPFFDTKNIDQFALAVTLLSRLESEDIPRMLLDAWEKNDNQLLSKDISLLDSPIVRIALAASLQRSGAFRDKKEEFEEYIYTQTKSDDDYIKSNAIISLSSFRDVKAVKELSEIVNTNPKFLLEAIRGLCNILINPESVQRAREIAEIELRRIPEESFSEEVNQEKAIKEEVRECLSHHMALD